MKAQRLECELHHHDHGFGNEGRSGELLIDPVADGSVLEGTTLDRGQRDLAPESSFDEDSEPESGTQLPLAFPDPAPGRETCGILRRGGSALAPELPTGSATLGNGA